MADKIKIEVDSALEDLIPGFLNNMNENVRLFREALGKDDFDFLRSRGHNIKGSGGGYGFDRITALGRIIEAAAKESNKDPIVEAVNELEDYLGRVDIVFV